MICKKGQVPALLRTLFYDELLAWVGSGRAGRSLAAYWAGELLWKKEQKAFFCCLFICLLKGPEIVWSLLKPRNRLQLCLLNRWWLGAMFLPWGYIHITSSYGGFLFIHRQIVSEWIYVCLGVGGVDYFSLLMHAALQATVHLFIVWNWECILNTSGCDEACLKT